MTGRPTDYSEKLAGEMCAMIANGNSISKISAIKGMPASTTFFRWLREHPEFRDNYESAKEEQADRFVEQMLEIADDAEPENAQVARLRLDTRKWIASKFKPKRYGDKITQEQVGEGGGAIKHQVTWTIQPVKPLDD